MADGSAIFASGNMGVLAMFQSVDAWGQIRPWVFATAFVTLAAVSKPAWATPTSGDADSGTSSSATSSSGELTEILVTARRRDEDLQKVPVAVNVLGPEALRQRGISRAEDLVIATPDLSVQTNLQGRNSAAFFIRGQGVSTGGVLPSVVTYFNEVPLDSNGGAAFGLYDLDSLQVLRGPQGTLFGRNANGGAVVLTPKAPGDTLEGDGIVIRLPESQI